MSARAVCSVVALAGLLVVPALVRGFGGSDPAQSYCAPDLSAVPQHPHGYRDRGPRCEGVYARDVGSTTLLVASLAESLADVAPGAGPQLVLEWAAPGAGVVHVRALGLDRRQYYRMDTRQPASDGRFVWPTDVLRGLNLDARRIGVLAWTEHEVGGVVRRVHLPVRAGALPAGSRPVTELIVVPGRELAEVYVSVSRLREDGSAQRVVRDGVALAHGYYPSERPLRIALPETSQPGLYHVEIGAEIRGGGSSAVELLLYSGER